MSSRAKNGNQPLHLASEAGHAPAVQILARARADLHATSERKLTPVHHATMGGHLSVVKLLRDLGAELSVADAQGCEPTTWAARRGDVPLLDFFLGGEGLSPDSRCDQRQTPAHHAAQWGKTAVLDALKRHKADLTLKDDRKHTPLHVAVELGVLPVIDWFATAGVKGLSPKTPGLLHLAAWTNQTASMQALLRHGAEAGRLEPKTKFPAVEFATTPETYELLAEHGASLAPGWVHRAAGRGQFQLLRHLVLRERQLEAALRQEHDGVYPAHLAAQGGHREVLQWLCGQMGANCSARSSSQTWSRTPVHYACLGSSQASAAAPGQLGALRYLLREQGCGADEADDNGITPLELAAVAGSVPIVEYLVGEHDASLSGLWQAKRARALHKNVDAWVDRHIPKGTYDRWLALGLPPRGRPKKQAKEQKAPGGRARSGKGRQEL